MNNPSAVLIGQRYTIGLGEPADRELPEPAGQALNIAAQGLIRLKFECTGVLWLLSQVNLPGTGQFRGVR
ncbi:hypothetical protein D3C80_2034440 [compost metagenome]